MEYGIGNAAEDQSFTVADLYTQSPDIDCGRAVVDFYDNDTTEVLNSALFEGLRPDDATGIFRVKQQSNIATAGTYDIFYSVALENYSSVRSKYSDISSGAEAFQVRLIDLTVECATTTGVTEQFPFICPEPTDDNSNGGGPVKWLKNLQDQQASVNDPTTIVINGGVCEANGSLNAVCEVLPLNDAADFYSYDGPTNTVTINPSQIQPEDAGYWLITFKVTKDNSQEYFKSIVLTVLYE